MDMTWEQSPDQPVLQGLRLTRTFGEGNTRAVALADVSLDLHAGEVALLMGPSGSGKTTLLAALSGLQRPNSGRVLARDQDLWQLTARERERFRLLHCGFVFQGYNLFPALTARQQLEIVLHWGEGISRRESRRRVDEMLALLDLTKKARLRPRELSGGDQQRVAIGRALIKQPRLLFADEPIGALDWANGKQVIELLRGAAHARGAMVLVVAHDLRVLPFADRVFYLEDGRLRQSEGLQGGARHAGASTPALAVHQAG